MQRAVRSIVWSGLCLGLGGCSVADVLTSEEILEELDEVVQVTGDREARQVVYADEAVVARDFMRWPALAPIRWPLAWMFGRRGELQLANPPYRVRELLRELPNETAGGWIQAPDLLTCAAAASRFAWFAELDPSATTRICALDGISRVCRQLDLRPLDGAFAALMQPQDPVVVASARDRARAATASMDLEALRAAVTEMTAQPLAVVADRILLVEELTEMLTRMEDPAAREPVADGLRAALAHCARGVLLSSLAGRSRELAEVRLCAMEQVRRLGGARAVPLMLAVMAASPAERANGVPHYDPDTLVQLRLIHYCGQLSPTLAAQVVRIPGRQDWEATTPAEFLARTVLSERDYYSQLRVPAIVALTWCLGRPSIDTDPAWVRAWIDGRDS
ncbi:MAG: hypothetical protein ACON4Z_00235 [Planctomycetota bacterium]